MRGANPIRKPVMDDGLSLAVKSIFLTIQGEGPLVGHPALFIRLGGCNLACDFCDTDFENFNDMALDGLLSEAKKTAEHVRLVVITGGEPLRQNIVPLCERLIAEGFTVQIETNGTLYRELPKEVLIVCSPKNTGNGYHPLRSDLLERVTALKYIVSAQHKDHHNVPKHEGNIPIYVQPMDEYDAVKNAENYKLAVKLALENNYRLSLQLHKIAGIP